MALIFRLCYTSFMKKSSIVYFCIACFCLLLVPIMAFIFLPVAFIYLLPAAIFFWLGKDTLFFVMKKVKRRFIGAFELLRNNFGEFLPKSTQASDAETTEAKTTDIDQEEFEQEIPEAESAISAESYEEPIADVTDEVKKQFDNMDMMTASAIAIMLCEAKIREASPYLSKLKKPDIRAVLLEFCADTYPANDIRQIDKLFNQSYYKRKVNRHLKKIKPFVRNGIRDSLPGGIPYSRIRKQSDTFIDRICESISDYESVKYTPALSGNEELADSKRNYRLDHLHIHYKDALIYLADVLLTCACISKVLFVERMVDKIDDESEFYKILENMVKSIENHNEIIEKSRPLYKQYYQDELGFIHGDDLLYGLAITVMVNRIKKNLQNSPENPISDDTADVSGFKADMLKWLDSLAKEGVVDDVGTLILQRITTRIKNNFELLTDMLQELTSWENFYSQRVEYYAKEEDRKRYLTGDFD